MVNKRKKRGGYEIEREEMVLAEGSVQNLREEFLFVGLL